MNNNKEKNIYEKFTKYEEYFLNKDNGTYIFIIGIINSDIIIKYKDYEKILNNNNISILKKPFNEIGKAYEYLINYFKKDQVFIKDIINNKSIKLLLKNNINNVSEDIEIVLEYNERKKDSTINKKINNVEYQSDPKNITFLKEIIIDSYTNCYLDNTFCIFKSINNIFYLVYSNLSFSIISININNNKKINEIKKAHEHLITNFRYYFDSINNIDLILSISDFDNNLKLWNINNFECILNIKHVNKDGCIYSACFMNYNSQNFIVTSNCKYYININENQNNYELIKVFDFNGNIIKLINESNEHTLFIDTYYDNKSSLHYIITGNKGYVKSYVYDNNKIYQKYNDNDNNYHDSIVINNKGNIIKLIESSGDGNLRIWNFHSGILLNKIKLNNDGFISLCLWNNQYLFVGCVDKSIKLIDLNNEKDIKQLIVHKKTVTTLKKIIIPQYGECLISQGLEDGQIKLWIIKA